MSPQEAFQRLGLGGGGTPEQVEAAFAARQARLKQKMASASSAAVRQAIEADMWELDAAREAALTAAAKAPGGAGQGAVARARPRPAALEYEPLVRTTVSIVPGTMVGGKIEARHPIAYVGGAQAFAATIPGPELKQASLFVVDDRLMTEQAARNELAAHVKAMSSSGGPVVGLMEVLRHDGHTVIVAEHLPGRTLAGELHTRKTAGRPVPIERAIAIGIGICEGLEAIHRQKAHGDLRPDNVWLLGTEAVKVLDLGLSTVMRTQPLSEVEVAGKSYRAPEQGEGARDARSDLYAAGAMMYELLTAAPPKEAGASVRDLRRDLPEHVASAIDRALSKKPDDRFANATAMLEALRRRSGARAGRRVSVAKLAAAVIAGALGWGATAIAWVPTGHIGQLGSTRLSAGLHVRRPWPMDRMTVEPERQTGLPGAAEAGNAATHAGTGVQPKPPDVEKAPAVEAVDKPKAEQAEVEPTKPVPTTADAPTPRKSESTDERRQTEEARARYDKAKEEMSVARREWRAAAGDQRAEPAVHELDAAAKAESDRNLGEAARLFAEAKVKYEAATAEIRRQRETATKAEEAKKQEQTRRDEAKGRLVGSLRDSTASLEARAAALEAELDRLKRLREEKSAALSSAAEAQKPPLMIELETVKLDIALREQRALVLEKWRQSAWTALERERDDAASTLDNGGKPEEAERKAAELAARGPARLQELEPLEAVAQRLAEVVRKWDEWAKKPQETKKAVAKQEEDVREARADADAAIDRGDLPVALDALAATLQRMETLERSAGQTASVEDARKAARDAEAVWEATLSPWKSKGLADTPAVTQAKQKMAQADASRQLDAPTARSLYGEAKAAFEAEASLLMQDAGGVSAALGADRMAEIHRVVVAGDAARLARMLKMGANPGLKNANGETPAVLAVRASQPDLLKQLLDAGASPAELGARQDGLPNVPLTFLAVESAECFEVIVRHRRTGGMGTLTPALATQTSNQEMLTHYIASRSGLTCETRLRLCRALLEESTLDAATKRRLLTEASPKSRKTAEQLAEGAGCTDLAQYLGEQLGRQR
ncbi:MAG: protein kinase domain-containing protein [Phycisphaerales bacterium]